jgi:integrase
MSGTHQLIAKLLYGSGWRLIECLRLRIKDIDFKQHRIIVRDGKGTEDRVTILRESLVERLRNHLRRVAMTHRQDLADGYGATFRRGCSSLPV